MLAHSFVRCKSILLEWNRLLRTSGRRQTSSLTASLQENQRLAVQASMAAAAGQALAHNITPGGVPPQSTPQFQPPPVATFGGLRLQPGADTQSAVPTSTTNPWAMGSQLEFQPSAATQTAATAPVEPRVLAPYAPAADPGSILTGPDVAFNPYTLYNPQVAGRRVFTAFHRPTELLVECTMLAHLSENASLALVTDASATAVGAVLQRVVDGYPQPLSFFSRKLSPTKQRYSAFGRELLAVYLQKGLDLG
ncbi:hypothetical protein ISCGN_024556 [Ixodes scapularis]